MEEKKTFKTLKDAYENFKETGEFHYKSEGFKTKDLAKVVLNYIDYENIKENYRDEVNIYHMDTEPEEDDAPEYYVVIDGKAFEKVDEESKEKGL